MLPGDRIQDPLRKQRLGAYAFFPGTSADPRSKCKSCVFIDGKGKSSRCAKYARMMQVPITQVEAINPASKACKYFEDVRDQGAE